MKIKFSKITIDNFLSFGHAEVNLENRGYTLIEGINNDPRDGAKSNGSGKSTIFSAICYALTGETIQGLTSNLNNIITNEDMSVNLEFSVDSDNASERFPAPGPSFPHKRNNCRCTWRRGHAPPLRFCSPPGP